MLHYLNSINHNTQKEENYAKSTIENLEKDINEFEFGNSLQTIWNLIARTNKYIDETSPWALAKEDENDTEEDKKIKEAKLKSVIYHLVATLKEIAILIRPLMEETSDQILTQLGFDKNVTWNDLNDLVRYVIFDEII